MSLKQIDQKIRLVATSGAKLNKLIHETAMMVASHAKEHGDCTRALSLVKAMPASMRRTMLVLWFSTYTPIRVVDKNDKVGMLKPEAKGFTDWDLEAGDLTPFYELAEQNPEAGVYDFAKLVEMVQRLGKQIDKKIADGKVPPEDVASAKAIAVAVAGLKFERVKAQTANDDQIVAGQANLMAVAG
jgi:hypothetical protein